MFVIPKAGLVIIDPVRRDQLPPEGRNVNDDHPFYWDRHRQDGSVTIITDPAKIKEADEKLEKADAERAAQARLALAKAEADAKAKADGEPKSEAAPAKPAPQK